MFHAKVLPHCLVAVALGLMLLGLVAASAQNQESADPLETAPLTLASRKAALEEKLVGCWNLMLYESREQVIDPRSVTGFLTFQDGYATNWWQARVVKQQLFGNTLEQAVQSQVLRYRISDFLELETAPVHSVDNLTGEFRVGGPLEPAAYDIVIEDEELILTKIDGTRMTYRKVASRFPERAIERLDETRGGRIPMPRNPLEGRR
ncbi:MAG: hypothetical protein WD226_07860 [Planctomycetota bacterium]